MEGEFYEDDKKSEFKTFLNMIYSARTSLSEMKITDDYGLAEDFMASKEFKLQLRELTEDETQRAIHIYDLGYKDYKEFVLHLLYDYLEIPHEENHIAYINEQIVCTKSDLQYENYICPLVETFIYELLEYKDRGRIYLDFDYFSELNGLWFAVYAFAMIVEEIIEGDAYRFANSGSFGTKHGQLRKYYRKKFAPMFYEEEDSFIKCILAYRFFVSAYDFCGFKYVGKHKLLYDYRNNLGKAEVPRSRFRLSMETKSIGIEKFMNVIEGYTVYATVELGSYKTAFRNSEVIMVTDDDTDETSSILGRMLVIVAKKDLEVKDNLFIGAGTLNSFVPGFEEKHNKSSLYFTTISRIPNELPEVTSERKMYLAFFITKQECEFIKENGCEKFEKELIDSKIDIWKLDRKSLF